MNIFYCIYACDKKDYHYGAPRGRGNTYDYYVINGLKRINNHDENSGILPRRYLNDLIKKFPALIVLTGQLLPTMPLNTVNYSAMQEADFYPWSTIPVKRKLISAQLIFMKTVRGLPENILKYLSHTVIRATCNCSMVKTWNAYWKDWMPSIDLFDEKIEELATHCKKYGRSIESVMRDYEVSNNNSYVCAM